MSLLGSNNTNKFSPQEHSSLISFKMNSSNNTNKFSPQELFHFQAFHRVVQIIQINLVLKNP